MAVFSGGLDPIAAIQREAIRQGVPPDLAVTLALSEGGLNPYAVGDQGNSFGIFQINRGNTYFTPSFETDPGGSMLDNIRAGIAYLRDQLMATGGNALDAFARYKGGPNPSALAYQEAGQALGIATHGFRSGAGTGVFTPEQQAICERYFSPEKCETFRTTGKLSPCAPFDPICGLVQQFKGSSSRVTVGILAVLLVLGGLFILALSGARTTIQVRESVGRTRETFRKAIRGTSKKAVTVA